MSQYTGEYEQNLDDNWKPIRPLKPFSFYTFTPRPLMDGKLFDIDEELLTMLTMTYKQLGILEGMIKLVPDIEIIRELMVLLECHFSRLIDYDGDYFVELLKAINSGKTEVYSTLNIVSAYKCSFEKNAEEIDFSQLCTVAINGRDSEKKIYEREKFIFLGKGHTNLKEYNPTAPAKIRTALTDISTFLSDNDRTDVLVKAALAHYQFEMIHPYECYNGIIGRIMFPMILNSYGIKSAPFVGLSEYLYYRKNDYFEILGSTQYSGGYIALIKFFVRCINVSAKLATARIEELVRIAAEDEAKIKASKPSKITWLVYYYFKRHLVSEIKPISEALSVSYNTVSKTVNNFLTMNILAKDDQQSRHRNFAYSRFVGTLSSVDGQ